MNADVWEKARQIRRQAALRRFAQAFSPDRASDAFARTMQREADAYLRRALDILEMTTEERQAARAYADRTVPRLVRRGAARWNRTLKEDFRRAIDEAFDPNEPLSKREIERVLSRAQRTYGEGRATVVAETEAHRISQEILLGAYRAANRELKQWVTRRDERVRPLHERLEGQVRPIGQPFQIPGTNYRAQRPGAFGIPDLDINCRCVAVPAVPGASADGLTRTWERLNSRLSTWAIRSRKALLRGLKTDVNRFLQAL